MKETKLFYQFKTYRDLLCTQSLNRYTFSTIIYIFRNNRTHNSTNLTHNTQVHLKRKRTHKTQRKTKSDRLHKLKPIIYIKRIKQTLNTQINETLYKKMNEF